MLGHYWRPVETTQAQRDELDRAEVKRVVLRNIDELERKLLAAHNKWHRRLHRWLLVALGVNR